nr:MAG TPA: Cytosine specific methyltransferase [Caudoviricetes sp.]
MEQIRIIKEMRDRDRRMGRTGEFVRPRYMVWENVPGAFSSNGGKDFAAVLEEAIRIAEPEAPDIEVPEKGWNTWGGYHDEMGGRWSVAWRVLDAQHWGVPQRRRRIALVADFGGDTAWEILFNRQSMSGYPAESGAEGEGPATGAESGAGGAGKDAGSVICLQGNAIDRADTAGCNGKGWKEDVCYTLNTIDRPAVCAGLDCLTPWDCQSKRVYSEAGVMPTLPAGENSGQNQEAVLCAGFKLGNSEQARSIGYAEEQAPTLNAECGGNKPAVLCLNDQGGNVMGVSHDVSGTLRAQEHGHQPSILDMSHACDVIRDCGEVAPSLQARMGTGGNQIPLTYQMQGFGDYREGGVASSCKQRDFKDSTDLVCSVDCRNFTEGGEINGTLQAKESGGQSLNLNNTVRQNMVVRRLTPLECERLQGFPDHWTDLGEWTDSRGKRHKDADSPRYKALGNSIALPPWKWLLKRLCGNYERDATMASLFDGIGGFPLVWEQLNGRGTCLWASEIEEFPIAVTKRRFGTLEEPGDMGRFLFPCGNERSGA